MYAIRFCNMTSAAYAGTSGSSTTSKTSAKLFATVEDADRFCSAMAQRYINAGAPPPDVKIVMVETKMVMAKEIP